jgi:succinate-semialdehyde dehydrogenase / glutarate-semialdehyde dehydrogenase
MGVLTMAAKKSPPPVAEPDPARSFTPRIDGRFLARLAEGAACAPGRELLSVEMPFTGEVLGAVPHGNPDDMSAAVAAARAAQPGWAAVPAAEKARILLEFHDLVIANAHEILDLIQLELGKSRKHAYEEVLDTAITARYYAHTATGFLRPRLRQGALPLLTMTREYRRPKGVVGVISPWNYPLMLSISDALAAIMAGNTVVIKPDSQTPFSALWVTRLLTEAGLPDGVVHVVTGPGSELGPTLIAGVDYLMFTGSTATGKLLAQAAAARLIDYSMELGGKNPALVLDDAPFGLHLGGIDLGLSAVDGLAFAISTGAGQVCVSCERLYVQAGVYDRFVPQLAEALQALRLGSSLGWDADVGSLASADQLAKVSAHVDDAVGKGAEVLAGGHARPDLGPYFYEPTLLAGVTSDMRLCRAETFGPVCSVYRFDDVDEAIARINDTDYGLNASIWTRDVSGGKRLAARIQAGTVGINDAYQATWASASPMGGFKESGSGRRHGKTGLLRFTETQTVAVERLVAIDRLPLLDHRRYAQVFGVTMRLLKHMPVIK